MKILKIGLHFWITITSVVSFLAGWILLAHAPKPIQTGSASTTITTALPPLEPLNTFPGFGSDEDSFSNQPSFNLQPSQNSQFRPSFRTGGS